MKRTLLVLACAAVLREVLQMRHPDEDPPGSGKD